MPNGDNPELPDLEEPPPFIEGAAGGPAFPHGGLSEADKQTHKDASKVMFGVGSALVIAGAVFTLVGGAFAAAGLALAGGFLVVNGGILGTFYTDPPQPFQHIVTFKRRRCRPPGMSDPVLSRVGIIAQQAAFTLVTARGYLDALERLAGAQQAQNLNWAVTHAGVARECRRTIAVDFATTAAAMNAAAGSLPGSAYDVALTPGSGGVLAWFESPGVEEALVRHFKDSGATTDEITAAIQWIKSDPKYTGSAATLSAELALSAKALYALAERLSTSGA
jgi:hypothetical protein